MKDIIGSDKLTVKSLIIIGIVVVIIAVLVTICTMQ